MHCFSFLFLFITNTLAFGCCGDKSSKNMPPVHTQRSSGLSPFRSNQVRTPNVHAPDPMKKEMIESIHSAMRDSVSFSTEMVNPFLHGFDGAVYLGLGRLQSKSGYFVNYAESMAIWMKSPDGINCTHSTLIGGESTGWTDQKRWNFLLFLANIGFHRNHTLLAETAKIQKLLNRF